MQEMMKAMMQGQGGDQADLEEMQRALFLSSTSLTSNVLIILYRNDVRHGRIGRSGRRRRRDAEHG